MASRKEKGKVDLRFNQKEMKDLNQVKFLMGYAKENGEDKISGATSKAIKRSIKLFGESKIQTLKIFDFFFPRGSVMREIVEEEILKARWEAYEKIHRRKY